MKRVFSVLLILALTLGLACTAFAAETEFVPSITVKSAPEFAVDENGNIGYIIGANGEVLAGIKEDCLIITAVSELLNAEGTLTDAEQLLVDVYNALVSGEMKIPAEKLDEKLSHDEMVVRDLFDLSWTCEDHPEMLEAEGVTLQLNFKTNLSVETELFCMTYKNSEWNPIVSVVNNGDGTMTCTFEHLCPVAFMLGEDKNVPDTGMAFNGEVMLWGAVMAVATSALVVVFAVRRKKEA